MSGTAVHNSKHKGTGVRIPFVVNRFAQGVWLVPEGTSECTLVVPGKPVLLRAQLKGVAIKKRVEKAESGEKPLEIKFEVYAKGKPFRKTTPVVDEANALTAEIVEIDGKYYAQASWTPDENAPSYPKEIVFCPRAKGLGEILSKEVQVAQQWVLDTRWSSSSALVGSPVDMLTKIHGIKSTESVQFEVYYVCDVVGGTPTEVLLGEDLKGTVAGEEVPADEEVMPGVLGECRDEHGQLDPNKKWYRVKGWRVPDPDQLAEARAGAGIEEPTEEERAEIRARAAAWREAYGVPDEDAAEGLFRPESYTLRFTVKAGEDLAAADKHVEDQAFLDAMERRFFLSL